MRAPMKILRVVATLGLTAALIATAYWLAPARNDESSRPEAGAASTSRADLESTIARMQARLDRAPDDVVAAVAMADALLRQSRVTGNAGLAMRAEAALQRTLERKPADYDARRMLAAVYLSQHRFRDAIRE